MAFKNNTWALSSIKVAPAGEFIAPEEGLQYLTITDASYDENNARYRVALHSLSNEADFNQTFFFSSKDDESFPPKLTNTKQMGIVASIGTALAGANIGIPNPADIIGGVVLADVKLREYNGKTYAQIWKFEPVPEDIATSYATIEQYSLQEDAGSEEATE